MNNFIQGAIFIIGFCAGGSFMTLVIMLHLRSSANQRFEEYQAEADGKIKRGVRATTGTINTAILGGGEKACNCFNCKHQCDG